MRIMLFAGKGGVGKTSVAAGTGVLLAERGLKTLVDVPWILATVSVMPSTWTGASWT